MCGIAGFISRQHIKEDQGRRILNRMNQDLQHRGPDGNGMWFDAKAQAGFAHTRLSIIDLAHGGQPMSSDSGNVITYNGEIYNYIELRQELGEENFHTSSDTEVILRAYEKWGEHCVDKLRGMFAFAIWDAKKQKIFIARDRFGIKPLYYAVCGDRFYFASEIKALLPYMDSVETDIDGLCDYFTFQFCIGEKTMFAGVRQLKPAHCGYVGRNLALNFEKYWEVHYNLDWNYTEKYFVEQVREKMFDSVALHLRSDVEVGAYLSGGLDSSLVAAIARGMRNDGRFQAFNGRFSLGESFDESRYARILAEQNNILLHEIDITEQDFVSNIKKVIYYLDHPVAGPGSFPQFIVSRLVQNKVKVVLAGLGGDEIFGGYARYLIAYFEQCIKGAIDGTMDSGFFVVTYESIIPNLTALQNYKPLIQEFLSGGIFHSRDERYFHLINRSNTFGDVVDWSVFNGTSSFDEFKEIYWGENVGKESYFDSMTHFDFKTLLPALLHVEDRMSMAHGIESRVPFLDHHLVELLATIPANIKFQGGELKKLLRSSFADKLPQAILERKDKMGFPVPLQIWMKNGGPVREFVMDTFRSECARGRFYLKNGLDIERMIETEGMFSRNIWAFLNLELWQQQFHDKYAGLNH